MVTSVNPLIPPIHLAISTPETDGKKLEPHQVGLTGTVAGGTDEWFGNIIFQKKENQEIRPVIIAHFTEMPKFPSSFGIDGTPESLQTLLKQVLKTHMGVNSSYKPYQFTEAAQELALTRSHLMARILRAIPFNPCARIKALRGWVYKSYQEHFEQLVAGKVLAKTIEQRVSLLSWIQRFLSPDLTDPSANAFPDNPAGTCIFSVLPKK